MKQLAEIVQFQKKQDAKFICSACGADRGCDCNAPAVEKLRAEKERVRVAARESMRKKRQQNQHSVNVNTGTEMPTEEEADESWQNDLYDQACLLLERMADATRRRLIAFIRKEYPQ